MSKGSVLITVLAQTSDGSPLVTILVIASIVIAGAAGLYIYRSIRKGL